jgi:RNA polymerase sigma factor (sigma-70 family)
VEASAVRAPLSLGRPPLRAPLLRLRSDEQLLALFRAGSDEAFGVLHDRYRQRLFAYVRQMLAVCSRQDAEDVMQDVFVRAYGALRADAREMNVRAWLYRVAHNRCIDHLRRPTPAPAEVLDVSRRPLHDPLEEAARREDLARLVADIARLPEQQRSALLMRELDGMSYRDLSAALDATVPAVKSLLVRARMGLVEAVEAREADCADIRRDLLAAYDRGVKASAHARRHLRTCDACTEYRTALRGMRRSFAALSPIGAGPLALVAQLLGVGGGGAAAGAGAGAGGGAMAGGGAIATVAACKVAAVVCTAAITAGGAVAADRLVQPPAPVHHSRPAAAAAVHAAGPAIAAAAPSAVTPRAVLPPPLGVRHTVLEDPATDAPAKPPATAPAKDDPAGATTDPATPLATPTPTPTPDAATGTTGTPDDPAATGTTPPASATPAPSGDGAATATASPTPAPTTAPPAG